MPPPFYRLLPLFALFPATEFALMLVLTLGAPPHRRLLTRGSPLDQQQTTFGIDPQHFQVLRSALYTSQMPRHALAGNTRPGSCAIPMEPGTLCDFELP